MRKRMTSRRRKPTTPKLKKDKDRTPPLPLASKKNTEKIARVHTAFEARGLGA